MKNIHFVLALCLGWSACDLERVDDGGNNNNGPTCPAAKFSTQVGGNNFDAPVEVLATEDCGFVVCGQTYFDTNGDARLFKVNDKGVQQWERTYGTSGFEYMTNFISLKSGGYLLCGGTTFYNSNPGTYDAFIVKTDANGIEAWQRYYTIADNRLLAKAVAETPDGGFLLVCSKGDFINSSIPEQIALIKIDANGTEEWVKTIVSTHHLYASDMAPTPDGGFIIAGSQNLVPSGGTNTYLLKLDAGGNKEWEKSYQSSIGTYSPGYGVAALPNGYAVAASVLGTNDHDFNVLFYDLNGVFKWEKNIGGLNADEAIDVDQTADNQIVVSGYSNSFGTQQEIYLIKLNVTSGATIWEKHFGAGSGIYSFVAPAHDDGFIVAGNTNTTNNADILLFKLDKDGN
jgi:hypothetical protein